MNRVFLILGSNINKERNLPRAVALLREMCRVAAVSSVYETAPVGLEAQPPFFNAAVLVETELGPAEIKQQVIGAIERALKRRRTLDKNAPRTIDVDIVLFNDAVLDYDPGDGRFRHIPDPDLRKFLHVAVPMAQLAPDLRHPETGETLAQIAAELQSAASDSGSVPIWQRPDIVV